MDDEERELKHMDLIQAVITRMAENSFAIKGWSITLVSALFALAAADMNERYAALALLPALSFWGLDAYYLRQERLFRKLYDAVRVKIAGQGGGIAVERYSMNTEPVKTAVKSWWSTVWSGTIGWLHGPIALAVVVVTAYAYIHHKDDPKAKAAPVAAEVKSQ